MTDQQTYRVSDDGICEHCDTLEQARETMERWLDEAPELFTALWGQEPYTVRINDPDGVEIERRTIVIEPAKPDCIDDHEHDWRAPYDLVGGIRENPGVWGHGGGIMSTSVCARCGMYRNYDSWHENLADGSHGEYTSYRDPDELSLAWVASLDGEA